MDSLVFLGMDTILRIGRGFIAVVQLFGCLLGGAMCSSALVCRLCSCTCEAEREQ